MKKEQNSKPNISKILNYTLLTTTMILTSIIFIKEENHLKKYMKEEHNLALLKIEEAKENVRTNVTHNLKASSYIEIKGYSKTKCNINNEVVGLGNNLTFNTGLYQAINDFEAALKKENIKYKLQITPTFNYEPTNQLNLEAINQSDVPKIISLAQEVGLSFYFQNTPTEYHTTDCEKKALTEAIQDAKNQAKILNLDLKAIISYDKDPDSENNISVTYIAK